MQLYFRNVVDGITKVFKVTNTSCIVVLTSRSIERMLNEGGSQAWVLNAKQARSRHYLVCCWNPGGNYAVSNEDRHRGEAFLVAPITAIEPAPDNPERYIIRFTKYAPVSVPNIWNGQRNPVRYSMLEALEIEPDDLVFQDIPSNLRKASPSIAEGSVPQLTIEAAKRGLAARFGVSHEAIEIIIRG